jgi:hypothetical protein
MIDEANAVAEKARLHLDRHHAARSWTEIMRELRVTLLQCAAELEK